MPAINAVQDSKAVKFLANLEHRILDAFVGRWRMEGECRLSPGPATKITGRCVGERRDNAHVVRRWDVHAEDRHDEGVEVLHYDGRSSTYRASFCFGDGTTREYEVGIHGDVLTYASESERCKLVISDAGNTITASWERLGDGLRWQPYCRTRATRMT